MLTPPDFEVKRLIENRIARARSTALAIGRTDPRVSQDFFELGIKHVKNKYNIKPLIDHGERAQHLVKWNNSKSLSQAQRHDFLQTFKASSIARSDGIDWEHLATITDGFNGSLIEKVVEEA